MGDNMISNAIEKIVSMAPAVVHQFGDRNYIDGPEGFTALMKPTPEPLIVHTLSGVVDYLTKEIDYPNALQFDHFVHVLSPTAVIVRTSFNGASFYERPEYIKAVFEPPKFSMSGYTSLEDFIIGLQAYFVQDENTAALLKLVGNIKDESIMQFTDDGVTQAVTARTGLSLVEVAPVPNPVTLRPFRTFPEIEQPASLFVCRMKQQEKQPPACGLWEADNKLWKVEAVKNIAEWLRLRVDIRIIA